MASTTPNIGLTLPTGAEKVSRQIINANNTIIDGKMGAVPVGQNLQGEIDALNSKIENIHCRNTIVDLSANSSHSLTLKDKSYIITMITSSAESARVIAIIKLGSYYKLLELGKGSYQTYFTESLSSTTWSVSVTYRTLIQILEFGSD